MIPTSKLLDFNKNGGYYTFRVTAKNRNLHETIRALKEAVPFTDRWFDAEANEIRSTVNGTPVLSPPTGPSPVREYDADGNLVKITFPGGATREYAYDPHLDLLTRLVDEIPNAINLHVAVKEVGREVVFLHRVEPGTAAGSYGVHVARLAGLPERVTEVADRILAELLAEAPLSQLGGATILLSGLTTLWKVRRMLVDLGHVVERPTLDAASTAFRSFRKSVAGADPEDTNEIEAVSPPTEEA